MSAKALSSPEISNKGKSHRALGLSGVGGERDRRSKRQKAYEKASLDSMARREEILHRIPYLTDEPPLNSFITRVEFLRVDGNPPLDEPNDGPADQV